jgi:hypothetical protein
MAALVGGFAFAAPARAGCSASDVGNALVTVIEKFPAGCLDDPEFIVALPYAIAILQLPNGEGATICNDIQAGSGDLGKVNTALGKSGITDGTALADVSSLLSDAADAANIASCACQTAQDPGWAPLISSLGACLQEGLCLADNDCSGSSTQIVSVNCSVSPCPPGSFDQIENCNGPGIWLPNPSLGNQSGAPVSYTSSAGGVLVTQTEAGYSQSGAVTVEECFCPAPMQISTQTYAVSGGGLKYPYLSCSCPAGTSPSSNATGPVACLCSSGPMAGQAAGADGSCAPAVSAGCPAGATEVDGKCVNACSATKVQLADGSCCDPAKATSCGVCCRAGQEPDPTTGSCVAEKTPRRFPSSLKQ